MGRGEIYFCTSLPLSEWSNLAEGPVLVPMLQRLLDAGAKRLQLSSMIATGELTPQDSKLPWRALTTGATDPRIHAGVYSANDRLLAINRPAIEDEPEILDPNEARKLFGVTGVETFLQPSKRSEHFEGEIWRIFLFSMMAALLLEGWLILPPRVEARLAQKQKATAKPKEMEVAA
jgi:hypothetical protein